jgi:HlyD family secretion protein
VRRDYRDGALTPLNKLDSIAATRPPAALISALTRRYWKVLLLGGLSLVALIEGRAFLRHSVTVVPIVRGTALRAVYGSGTIEADGRVDIKARTAGAIKQLYVREDDLVQAGDLLAVLDRSDLQSEVELKESELSAAYARSAPRTNELKAQERALATRRDQALRELERFDDMALRQASSAQSAERARLSLELLQQQLAENWNEQARLRVDLGADTQRAEAELRSAQARASEAEVRAPIAGTVLARFAQLGEVVDKNQNLFRVGDTTRLQVETVVDETDVPGVRVGMPARVRIAGYEQTPVQARVRRIFPEAARDRRGFHVHLELLELLEGLRPGASAECNIVIEERAQAVLAPADAVRDGAVWLVQGNGRLNRRPIELGFRNLGWVEVLRGLELGDQVVISSVRDLKEGDSVNVRVQPRLEARLW